MPLDQDARRYADNLFADRLEEINARHSDERQAIAADFSRRGLPISGAHFSAIGNATVSNVGNLADARAESLLKAYERAGLPYDDAALTEITEEVMEFCTSQQHNAISFLSRYIHQYSGGAMPPGVEQAVGQQIERGVSAIMARIGRRLRLKRDETILDEKKARNIYAAAVGKRWDAFISHASEDKESFVRPLAAALEDSGLSIWFDETALKIGDSLRRRIDEGLANSRYGIVVLSESFFAKPWPQQELDGQPVERSRG